MNEKVKISVVIGVTDEVECLIKNLNILMKSCMPDDIEEIILVCHSRTTIEMKNEVMKFCETDTQYNIKSFYQKNDDFGYLLFETLPVLNGNYVAYCVIDNATDLSLVNVFAQQLKKYPESAVFASRWVPGGGFEKEYGKFFIKINKVFQKTVSILYKTKLSDFSFAYQCVPVSRYRELNLVRTDISVFFESRLRLIKSGVNIIEVPAVWKGRPGEKQKFYLKRLLSYIHVIFTVLFEK